MLKLALTLAVIAIQAYESLGKQIHVVFNSCNTLVTNNSIL